MKAAERTALLPETSVASRGYRLSFVSARVERSETRSTMPKMKTKRAAMKRFKKTGTGKLKRWHANHSHILTKKTRKRKNRLKKGDLVSSADFPRVSRLLQA
jgi:large subunit ribosomal protein L35